MEWSARRGEGVIDVVNYKNEHNPSFFPVSTAFAAPPLLTFPPSSFKSQLAL